MTETVWEHFARRETEAEDAYHMYQVQDRLDFTTFIEMSDELQGSQTLFRRMNMKQVFEFQTAYGEDYISNKLADMISLLPQNRPVVFDPHSMDLINMTNGDEPRDARYKAMAKMFSMHKLQKEPVFTSPITLTASPKGYIKAAPGSTRMLFANRSEEVDVMITNYRPFEHVGDWKPIKQYSMRTYDGMNIGSYRLTANYASMFGFWGSRIFHKELIMDINSEYRFQEMMEPFHYGATSSTVSVNNVPLLMRVGTKWEVIPYDR